MKIFPAIDLLEGRCVRLVRGRFSEKTFYGDPAEQLAVIRRCGAGFVHIVDLDGAKDPGKRQDALIGRLIRRTRLKVQVGGGIRAVEQAKRLLALGADRVVIGSLLTADPPMARRMFEIFGGRRLTAALDVRIRRGAARVASDAWRREGEPLEELIEQYLPLGLKRVLCTDIDRDGTLEGPNAALYRRLARRFPDLEIQASGGVGSLADLRRLKKTGVHSVVVGKALYEGKFDLREALALC